MERLLLSAHSCGRESDVAPKLLPASPTGTGQGLLYLGCSCVV